MARPRNNSSPELSAGQASYVLRRLISERRLSPGEVNRYLGDMRQEITDLERKLEDLRAAIGGSSSSRPSGSSSGAPARRGRPGRPPGRPRQAASGSSSDASQGSSQGSPAQPASRPGRKRRQGKELSAEQMASRKLQGRYLALVRQIPAARRGQYSKIAKESGREAAIQRMEEALRK
jgi:hypothetical protein